VVSKQKGTSLEADEQPWSTALGDHGARVQWTVAGDSELNTKTSGPTAPPHSNEEMEIVKFST
jgi:hypothetical protein